MSKKSSHSPHSPHSLAPFSGRVEPHTRQHPPLYVVQGGAGRVSVPHPWDAGREVTLQDAPGEWCQV
jgi:hypothetical protein